MSRSVKRTGHAPAGNRLSRAQDVLDGYTKQVSQLGYPSLGPEFKTLRGSVLESALVAHRSTSKYVIPNKANGRLHEESIAKMLRFDEEESPDFDLMQLPTERRLHLIRARHWLAETLKGFKLPKEATRFPSGEGFSSAKGETDLLDKLLRDDQWNCNAGSLDYAANLCYNTNALKKAVRSRYNAVFGKTLRCLPKPHAMRGEGRCTFKRMFKAVVNIEPARLTTVAKDNTSRRVISIEPTWAMVAQLQLAQGLRTCLLKNRSYDLDKQAALNKLYLSLDDKPATIDLKNASNSNWRSVVKALWPPHIFSLLDRFRSDTFFESGGESSDNYYYLNMLSPMGNGFTFEVMTLTLMALMRVIDDRAVVFGDDIIIKTNCVHRAFSILKSTGWKINHTKTFTRGNFRESCGAFYSIPDRKYLKSYDIHRPEDLMDVCTVANKLYRLLKQCDLERKLRSLVLEAYTSLLVIMQPFTTNETGEELPEGRVLSPFRNFNSPARLDKYSSFIADYQRVPRFTNCIQYRHTTRSLGNENVGAVIALCYVKNGGFYRPIVRNSETTFTITIEADTERELKLPCISSH